MSLAFSNACHKKMREELARRAKAAIAVDVHRGVKRALNSSSFHPAPTEDMRAEIESLTALMKKFELKTGAQTYTSMRMALMREKKKKEFDEYNERRRIGTRVDISTNPLRDAKTNIGDIRLKKIRKLLNCFGLVRSQDQQLFHEWYVKACLPIIYGDGFLPNYTRVMRENELKKLSQEILVLAPRRFGKTYAIAMFVAVLLLCVPGIEISIFSTGDRASSKLTDLIKTMFLSIEGASDRIVKDSNEHLYVSAVPLSPGQSRHGSEARRMRSSPTTSRLNSFPGSSKGKCSSDISLPLPLLLYNVNDGVFMLSIFF